MGFYLGTTSKRRSPFLPACTASTSTIRPGACLKSCGINLILGMRTHITRGSTSRFALSLGITRYGLAGKAGSRMSRTRILEYLHDSIWGHAHMAQDLFFHPKEVMRHNRHISGAWTTFVLDKSEGSRRRVWSVLMTRSAHMFGLPWDSNLRRGRIFSRPGRDLTPRNNFWQISKMRLPRPLTSPVTSLAIGKHCSMDPHPWTSCLGSGSICHRATWHSIQAISRGTTTKSK